MTTAYLVLCTVRDYLQRIKPGESIEMLKNQIASTDIDEEGNDVFRYRIVLQYEDSCGVLERIAQQEDLGKKVPETRSAQNIKNAYDIILRLLRRELEQNDAGVQDLKKFYAYFTRNVKLVRVKTASLADALRVFATINNRGVSLDDMDLLKNLMFMEADKKVYDSLKDKWKKMVDILFGAKENPIRFIRYFILARYDDVDSLKKEDGIYGWFLNKNNKACYQNKPIAFVDNLLEAAKAYVRFLEGKDVKGNKNRYLENIRTLAVLLVCL